MSPSLYEGKDRRGETTMSLKNPRNTLDQRRSLRRSMTSAEKLFWVKVRNKRLLGMRFKRQYGIGPYILDFFIPQLNICIEIDGSIHDLVEVKRKDVNKDAFLKQNGIHVLRFKNHQIENDMDSVIDCIKKEIANNV